MRLYRFASSKDELLDGIVELVLTSWRFRPTFRRRRGPRSCEPRPTPIADWRCVTRTSCRCWSPARATPLGLRPLGTLRPLEALLDLLIAAGFDPTAPCTPTASSWASSRATCSTSCKNACRTRTRPSACSGWSAPATGARVPPGSSSSPPRWPRTDGARELDEGSTCQLGWRAKIMVLDAGPPGDRLEVTPASMSSMSVGPVGTPAEPRTRALARGGRSPYRRTSR